MITQENKKSVGRTVARLSHFKLYSCEQKEKKVERMWEQAVMT
jgi:hypothetical protein